MSSRPVARHINSKACARPAHASWDGAGLPATRQDGTLRRDERKLARQKDRVAASPSCSRRRGFLDGRAARGGRQDGQGGRAAARCEEHCAAALRVREEQASTIHADGQRSTCRRCSLRLAPFIHSLAPTGRPSCSKRSLRRSRSPAHSAARTVPRPHGGSGAGTCSTNHGEPCRCLPASPLLSAPCPAACHPSSHCSFRPRIAARPSSNCRLRHLRTTCAPPAHQPAPPAHHLRAACRATNVVPPHVARGRAHQPWLLRRDHDSQTPHPRPILVPKQAPDDAAGPCMHTSTILTEYSIHGASPPRRPSEPGPPGGDACPWPNAATCLAAATCAQ